MLRFNFVQCGSLQRVRLLLVFLCLALGERASGQDVIQKTFKIDGKSFTYSVLQPTDSIKGILLLFPGKGESPKSVFKKSAVPGMLVAKGFMTIVPNLKYALFADELIRKQLTEIMRIESENRKLTQGVAIGGFSGGGSVAVSFAAYLVSQGGESNLKSVFAIDPPLDLQRLYASSRRMRKYNCSTVQAEGQSTIDYLDKALGGSPDDQYANYVTSSPFMESESDGGNAKWLKHVPVRLYTEPDIDFVKERHCVEMEPEDLNARDLENLSKRLKYSGNDRCEYVVTKGRGYHSWNIAEPAELTAWIVKFGGE